jgi:outer membrane protein assembly factor BamA
VDAPKALIEPTIGAIFVVGNAFTPTDVILREIGIHAGDPLKSETLRAAERRLARLGVFVVDPERNIRPRIVILNPGERGPFHLLIEVKEVPTSDEVIRQVAALTLPRLAAHR